jgi:hypothetical protein
MKRQRILSASVFLLAVASIPDRVAASQPMIDAEAPAFGLPALSGEPVSLSDYSGKIVVLHFGAGW